MRGFVNCGYSKSWMLPIAIVSGLFSCFHYVDCDCQPLNDGICLDMFTKVEIGGSNDPFCTNMYMNYTWSNARHMCRSLGTRMMYIQNEAEFEALSRDTRLSTIWLGYKIVNNSYAERDNGEEMQHQDNSQLISNNTTCGIADVKRRTTGWDNCDAIHQTLCRKPLDLDIVKVASAPTIYGWKSRTWNLGEVMTVACSAIIAKGSGDIAFHLFRGNNITLVTSIFKDDPKKSKYVETVSSENCTTANLTINLPITKELNGTRLACSSNSIYRQDLKDCLQSKKLCHIAGRIHIIRSGKNDSIDDGGGSKSYDKHYMLLVLGVVTGGTIFVLTVVFAIVKTRAADKALREQEEKMREQDPVVFRVKRASPDRRK